MARVKRGSRCWPAAQENSSRKLKGLLQCPLQSLSHGEAGGHQGRSVCVSRLTRKEA